jgi:hypothetical protein
MGGEGRECGESDVEFSGMEFILGRGKVAVPSV